MNRGERRRRSPEERFWSHVAKGEPDACWEWQAFTNPAGYGVFVSECRGESLAHRIAFTLAKGRKIRPGRLIRHRCHNRRCVNPAHLQTGTHDDNMTDLRAKNRARRALQAAAEAP